MKIKDLKDKINEIQMIAPLPDDVNWISPAVGKHFEDTGTNLGSINIDNQVFDVLGSFYQGTLKFALIKDHQVLTICELKENTKWPDKHLCFIEKIVSNPKFKIKGLATQLIKFLIDKSGNNLLCGDQLTPLGLQFWKRFQASTGIAIELFDNISGKEYTLSEVGQEDNGITVVLPENDKNQINGEFRFFYVTKK